MLKKVLRVSHAAVPEEGEDSFALRSDEQGAFLCVTDGCGGLGSRRYDALQGRTGAFIASRLAARVFSQWVQERQLVLSDKVDTQALCCEAEEAIFDALKHFADSHCSHEQSRIVGSLQRRLPATLCAATLRDDELCFWWAGDSRGYVMDEDGLHQYTKDHLRGKSDAFDMLYRDEPLSNYLCADRLGRIHCRKIQLNRPCIVLVATDGVYSSLPSPMEVEMLILDTMRQAISFADWEKRLQRRIVRNAQDDATLLLCICGFSDFESLKASILPRRETLQKQFITPVRRHRDNVNYAREKWLIYKAGYDRTEDGRE